MCESNKGEIKLKEREMWLLSPFNQAQRSLNYISDMWYPLYQIENNRSRQYEL